MNNWMREVDYATYCPKCVNFKVLETDEEGRVKLSMKALLDRPAGMPEREPRDSREPRGDRGDRGDRAPRQHREPREPRVEGDNNDQQQQQQQ